MASAAQRQRQQNRRRKQKLDRYFDRTLLLVVLFLLFFGLIILFSSSSYEGNMVSQDPAFFLKRQAFATSIGLVGMTFFRFFDYHVLRKYALFIYLAGIAIIPFVLLFDPVNGARRWIRLGPLSFQPSEAVKVTVIIFMAAFLELVGLAIRNLKNLAIVLAFVAVPALMIGKITNNMSSAITIAGIACIMIFVADKEYKRYFALVGALGAIVGMGLLLVMKIEGSFGFRGDRIRAWMSKEDMGFQTTQALYAIGSGGFWGKGLGQSMQKLGFLPEAQNDMVFCIVCEEMGLFGAICLIILFAILLWRFLIIANNAPDYFGGMLVVGVFAHIALQVVLNIAVVTDTIPNTGIPLPFISYGGTSICFLLAEIGIVLNVSSQIHLKDVG